MKLSAFMTLIVVVVFTTATKAATELCSLKFAEESGCSPDDIAEIVYLLNLKFKATSGRTGQRGLNERYQEASKSSIRGTHTQDDRELQGSSCPANCQLHKDGYWASCYAIGCGWRRYLQSSGASNAEKFGQLIKGHLGTFGWKGCNPSNLNTITCEEI